MTERDFTSTDEFQTFALKFVTRHLERFEKDIKICLKPDEQKRHAYFPALMACFGFLDLFSSLYAGRWKAVGGEPEFKKWEDYTRIFAPQISENLILTILYHCFRHKIAHLAHPYDVFDTDRITSGKRKTKLIPDRRLVTWNVKASHELPSIELIELPEAPLLATAPAGWGVKADHLMVIRVGSLAEQLVGSVRTGYLPQLTREASVRRRFTACMNEYFPEF